MAEDGKGFDKQVLEEVQEILGWHVASFIRIFNKVKNWTRMVAAKSKETKRNLSYSRFIHLA